MPVVPAAASHDARAGAERADGEAAATDRGVRACLLAAWPPSLLPGPGLSGGQGSSPNTARRAARTPEPPPLAAGPRSALTACSGPGPPLGGFRFRFPADIVEENETGRGQGWSGCLRGEGCRVRRQPAWSLEPGAGAAACAGRGKRSPFAAASRAPPCGPGGRGASGRLTRAGRPGVPPSGLGGPETRSAGALEPLGPLSDLGELRQTCQRSGGLESRWDRGKLGHRSHHTFPFYRTANPFPQPGFCKMEVECMQSASPELRGEQGAHHLLFLPITSLLFPTWLRSSCSLAFSRFQTWCTWAPLRCSPCPWQLPSRLPDWRAARPGCCPSPRPAHVKTAR